MTTDRAIIEVAEDFVLSGIKYTYIVDVFRKTKKRLI
jgi:hypothetical protein